MTENRKVSDGYLPFVSCYCPTYARPYLLEEAIESFLRQDYAGRKELVILNDMPEQELVFEHPEVRIINSSERITPLGKKFNDCLDLCGGDVLFVWDDDDIYLPWRLSYSINNMLDGVFHTMSAWYETGHSEPLKSGKNLFHCNLAYERSLLDEIGFYVDKDVHSLDVNFMERLGVKSQDINEKNYFYIYRWSGTGSYHISQWANCTNSVSVSADEYVRKEIEEGRAPVGKIILKPHWSRDWLSLANTAVTGEEENRPASSFEGEVLEVKSGVSLNINNLELYLSSESGSLFLECNQESALIYQSINGRRTNSEIETIIKDIFPDASVEEDVRSALNEFKRHGIVNVVGDLSTRLNIAIVSHITSDVAGYGQHAESINREYAIQAGYDFHVLRDWSFTDRVVNWGCVYMLKKYIADYDYLLWLDADAVVTRFDMSLERFIHQSPDRDILACNDWPNGTSIINTGAILVKNSFWTKRFLDEWWERGKKAEYNVGTPTDQKAFSHLHDENVLQVKKHLHVFPTNTFNSIYPGQHNHKHEDFILHLMATPNDLRKQIFSELQERLLD